MSHSGRSSSDEQAKARALTRLRVATTPLFPWLGLVSLWLLFELPSIVKPGVIDPGAMRPTLDVLALLTLWGASFSLPRFGRVLRVVLGIVAGVLFAYRLDALVFRLLMREDPLLYDQWFMLHHLVVLISDLLSFQTVLVVGGFVVTVGLMVFAAGRCLDYARVLTTKDRRRQSARVLVAVWALALALYVGSDGAREPHVRLLVPNLVQNVRTSIDTYAGIQRGLAHSPYEAFDRIALNDKPDVLLFIVESYGRLLSSHDDTRDRHALLLDKLEQKLADSGWSAVSAFGTSSVSGGRSWLAEGTMLMGTNVRYEAVFQHLVAEPGKVPSLVRFFQQNDYETVLLTPADRERVGVHRVFRYPFERVLDHDDMGYTGPAMGWGIVPDQYSLAVARDEVLDDRKGKKPLFLDFHMVTSHAPWSAVPPLVSDPKSLNQLRTDNTKGLDELKGTAAAMTPIRHFHRDEDATTKYMNTFTEPMRRGYQATVSYDLNVIARYLAEREDDALVIVLGDHQPPVITKAAASFDTPIHIFSKNPKRLAPFLKQGFEPGMAIDDEAKPALSHAGLFSLLVGAMAAHDGKTPPPVLKQGYALVGSR